MDWIHSVHDEAGPRMNANKQRITRQHQLFISQIVFYCFKICLEGLTLLYNIFLNKFLPTVTVKHHFQAENETYLCSEELFLVYWFVLCTWEALLYYYIIDVMHESTNVNLKVANCEQDTNSEIVQFSAFAI